MLDRILQGAVAQSSQEALVAGSVLEGILENMSVIVVLMDVDGTITYVNRAFEEKHALSREQCIGKQVWEVAEGVPQDEVIAGHDYVRQHLQPLECDCVALTSKGVIPYRLNLLPIFDGKQTLCALCALVENLRPIREAEFSALHDCLTGLANRRLLEDRINQSIMQSRREGGMFALCFIDLNGFKQVNDEYGHVAGDELLTVVARRISGCLRDSDTLARYGGDEFVILLRGSADSEEVRVVMARVELALSDRIFVQGQALSVSYSLGCASYPDDGDTEGALLQCADSRMYEAKAEHYKYSR